LPEHLAAFVDAQIKYLRDYKRTRDPGSNAAGEKSGAPDDNAIERKYWETMHEVLNVALRVAPLSQDLLREMALAEEYFGKLESAHQRLNTLIGSSRDPGDPVENRKLMGWIVQRSRIIARRSAELQSTGKPADLARALDLIRQSRQSLDQCKGVVSELAGSTDPLLGDRERVYYYLWTSTDTWLGLGELERQRGDQSAAASAFRRAKESFDFLDYFGRTHFPEQQPSKLETLRKRVKAGLGVKMAASN
jgi:hypothetical protein